jgi:hypothetical protein
VWRRMYVPPSEAYRFRLPQGRMPWFVIGLGFALGLTTWLAVSSNLTRQTPSLSITSPTGLLSGYPFEVAVGSRYVLTLHIDNPTSTSLRYHLVMTGGSSRLHDERISVVPGERWSERLTLPSNFPPRSEVLHFMLTDGNQIVRRLWIKYRIAS